MIVVVHKPERVRQRGKKMKTLAELQEEYLAEEESFKRLGEEHRERVARIKDDVMSHAKYAPGDRVWYIQRVYFDSRERQRIPGIIRAVFAGPAWRKDHSIVPLYTIGKTTKSGAIHAIQNIGWRETLEEDIEPREEV